MPLFSTDNRIAGRYPWFAAAQLAAVVAFFVIEAKLPGRLWVAAIPVVATIVLWCFFAYRVYKVPSGPKSN